MSKQDPILSQIAANKKRYLDIEQIVKKRNTDVNTKAATTPESVMQGTDPDYGAPEGFQDYTTFGNTPEARKDSADKIIQEKIKQQKLAQEQKLKEDQLREAAFNDPVVQAQFETMKQVNAAMNQPGGMEIPKFAENNPAAMDILQQQKQLGLTDQIPKNIPEPELDPNKMQYDKLMDALGKDSINRKVSLDEKAKNKVTNFLLDVGLYGKPISENIRGVLDPLVAGKEKITIGHDEILTGNVLRGAGRLASGGLQVAMDMIPAVVGLNATMPIINEAAGGVAEALGGTKQQGEEIAGHIAPFLFGRWIGAASLVNWGVDEGMSKSGILNGLSPEDQMIARETVGQLAFFGTLLGGKSITKKYLDPKLDAAFPYTRGLKADITDPKVKRILDDYVQEFNEKKTSGISADEFNKWAQDRIQEIIHNEKPAFFRNVKRDLQNLKAAREYEKGKRSALTVNPEQVNPETGFTNFDFTEPNTQQHGVGNQPKSAPGNDNIIQPSAMLPGQEIVAPGRSIEAPKGVKPIITPKSPEPGSKVLVTPPAKLKQIPEQAFQTKDEYWKRLKKANINKNQAIIRVQRLVKSHGAVSIESPDGSIAVLSSDTRKPGKYKVSWFNKNGEPVADVNNRDLEEAAGEFVGNIFNTSNGKKQNEKLKTPERIIQLPGGKNLNKIQEKVISKEPYEMSQEEFNLAMTKHSENWMNKDRSVLDQEMDEWREFKKKIGKPNLADIKYTNEQLKRMRDEVIQKANGKEKIKPVKVKRKIVAKGSGKQQIEDIPLDQIKLNEKDFQGRAEPFSGESFKKIVLARVQSGLDEGKLSDKRASDIIKAANDYLKKNNEAATPMSEEDLTPENTFSWNDFGQVLLWEDKKGNKQMLSGHSRRAASDFLKDYFDEFKTIPAMVEKGISFDEAQRKAQQSNIKSTPESLLSQVKKIRTLKEKGKSEKDIRAVAKTFFGSDANKIVNLSNLNPDGYTIQALKSAERDPHMNTIANWIGNLIGTFPQLTKDHENEIYKWLVEDGAYNKIVKNMTQLRDLVERRIEKTANFGEPLNFGNAKNKGKNLQDYESDLADKHQELNNAKADLEKARGKWAAKGFEGKELEEKISNENAYVNRIEAEYQKLLLKKNAVIDADMDQGSLFNAKAPIESRVKKIQDQIDIESQAMFPDEAKLKMLNDDIRKLKLQQAEEESNLGIQADVVKKLKEKIAKGFDIDDAPLTELKNYKVQLESMKDNLSKENKDLLDKINRRIKAKESVGDQQLLFAPDQGSLFNAKSPEDLRNNDNLSKDQAELNRLKDYKRHLELALGLVKGKEGIMPNVQGVTGTDYAPSYLHKQWEIENDIEATSRLIRQIEKRIPLEVRLDNQIELFNARAIEQTKTAEFKAFFKNSKVVDQNGNPLVVYSGHGNTTLYGNYDPKKSTAGGFYATENPQIASNYSLGKFGVYESYEHGDQYRIKGKNGKYNKKLWQIRLTDEQKKTLDNIAEQKNEYGEYRFSIREMESWAKSNRDYEPLARRILARGIYDLQSIYEYNDWMGYNIAYDKPRTEAGEPPFLLQTKNDTEEIMDALGLEWNSLDWAQPGVFPIYLSIQNPLDADLPFPSDLLAALKEKAKYERSRNPENLIGTNWTKDYSLREWVNDIESGSEYWTTQIPRNALPIIEKFGYDGIKEHGMKGILDPTERQVNWIAFHPEQIKSAIANKGTFDPYNKDMVLSAQKLRSINELTQEKIRSTIKTYHLKSLLLKNTKLLFKKETEFLSLTFDEWIKYRYNPITNNFPVVRKGDPDYEEGKTKYKAIVPGRAAQPCAANGWQGKIVHSGRTDLATGLEETVHIFQAEVKRRYPILSEAIRLFEEAAIKFGKENRLDLPLGEELFAKSFVAQYGYGILENTVEIPQPIFDAVEKILNESTTGEKILDLYYNPRKRSLRQYTPPDLKPHTKPYPLNRNQMELFSARPPTAPPFYSKLQRTIEAKLPSKFVPEQLQDLISKGEVKKAEVEWSGLDDWIKKQKGKISKEDVLNFLRANDLQVKTTTLEDSEKVAKRLELEKAVIRQKITDKGRGEVGDLLYKKIVELRKEQDETWNMQTYDLLFDEGMDPEQRKANGIKYDKVLERRKDLQAEILDLQEKLSKYYVVRYKDEYEELDRIDQELQDVYSRKSTISARYKDYTIDGGENYQEVLYRLPTTGSATTMNQIKEIVETKDGEWVVKMFDGRKFIYPDAATSIEARNNFEKDLRNNRIDVGTMANNKIYRSPHWNQTNVLAHTRVDDRIINGKKYKHIEEIQSDWALEGRKKGFSGTKADYENALKELNDYRATLKEKYGENWFKEMDRQEGEKDMELIQKKDAADKASFSGIPDMPFKNTWHEFVLKNILRDAVEKGYDGITWTTGEQQADRYDLSKVVDAITWETDNGNKLINLEGVKNLSTEVKIFVDGKTGIIEPLGEGAPDDWANQHLSDLVGKDIADKILNGTEGSISGLGLKIGGEWAVNLYDKVIPNFLNKYTKKWGAKVSKVQMEQPDEYVIHKSFDSSLDMEYWYITVAGKGDYVYDGNGLYHFSNMIQDAEHFYSEKEAQSHIKDIEIKDQPLHSLEFTDEMKDSLLFEGQPLFNAKAPDESETPRLDKYLKKVQESMPEKFAPEKEARLKELNAFKELTPEEKKERKALREEKESFQDLDPFEKHRLSTMIGLKIKHLRTGYNIGAGEKQKQLTDLKKDISAYARLILPRANYRKSELTPLLTALSKANDLEAASLVFNRIRDLERKVRKRVLIGAINKMIRNADRSKGDPDFVIAIKNIRRLKPEDVELEIAKIYQVASNRELTDEEDQFLYLLQRFSDIKNKSVEQLEDLYKELKEAITEGRSRRKEWLKKEKERIQELKTQTVNVITGGKGVLSDDKARVENLDRELRTAAEKISDFDTVMHSWEWILDKLSKHDKGSAPLRSFLNNYYADKIHDSRNREDKGLRDNLHILRNKMMEIYGETGHKLQNILHKNSERLETGASRTSITERDEEGNPTKTEQVRLIMSQNEAAYMLMVHEDPTLDKTFEKMGYTDKTWADLKKFVNPKVMQWAQWQINNFYPEYYGGVNEVYKQQRGVDLNFNKKYMPISRDVQQTVVDQEFLGDNFSEFVSIFNGHLQPRIANTQPIRIQDIDRVLMEHIIEMEHFKAFASIMKDLRGVFGTRQVSKAIKQYHSTTMLKVVNRFINDFARGGVDRRLTVNTLDIIRSNFAKSVIGLNPVVLIKQLTSFPAYMMDMPIKDFVVGVGDFLLNPVGKTKFLLRNSEHLKTRYSKGWERDIVLAMQRARKTTSRELAKPITFTDIMMFLPMVGDAGAIMLGGWAQYRYSYNQAIKKGKTPEAAKKEAIFNFEQATKRSQQAGDVEDLGELQRQGSWAKLWTLFKTSPKQYYSNMSGALRNMVFKRGKFDQNLKRLLVAHFILPQLFQFAQSGFNWDTKSQLRALALGSLNGLLIAGDILETFIMAVTGDSYYSADTTPLTSVAQDVVKGLKQLNKWAESMEPTYEDFLLAVDELASGLSKFAGIPYDPVKRVGTGVKEFIEHPESTNPLRVVGFSEYTTRPPKPEKSDTLKLIQERQTRLNEMKKEARKSMDPEDIKRALEYEKGLKDLKSKSTDIKKQKQDLKDKRANDPFTKPKKPRTQFGVKLLQNNFRKGLK